MELSERIKILESMISKPLHSEQIGSEFSYIHCRPDPKMCVIEQVTKDLKRLAEIQDILGPDYDIDHLRELIQADREEKCLILPCKVGDTVYKFDASICKYRDKDKCDEYCDGFQYRDCWEGSQIVAATNFELKMLWSFGKTVFPTREEAEAALEKMKGGTHGNK